MTEDTSLQGTRIPAGSRVNLMLGSANRDGERWDRPDEFDITRPDATQHLGFGFGEHVCIGQGLAKLEITSLLEAMIRHVDRIEIGCRSANWSTELACWSAFRCHSADEARSPHPCLGARGCGKPHTSVSSFSSPTTLRLRRSRPSREVGRAESPSLPKAALSYQ